MKLCPDLAKCVMMHACIQWQHNQLFNHGAQPSASNVPCSYACYYGRLYFPFKGCGCLRLWEELLILLGDHIRATQDMGRPVQMSMTAPGQDFQISSVLQHKLSYNQNSVFVLHSGKLCAEEINVLHNVTAEPRAKPTPAVLRQAAVPPLLEVSCSQKVEVAANRFLSTSYVDRLLSIYSTQLRNQNSLVLYCITILTLINFCIHPFSADTVQTKKAQSQEQDLSQF